MIISIKDLRIIFLAVEEARVAVEREITEDRHGFFNARTALEAMETTTKNRLAAAINVIKSDYDE